MKANYLKSPTVHQRLLNGRRSLPLVTVFFAVVAGSMLSPSDASAQPTLKNQTLGIAETTFPWAKMELKNHVPGMAMPGTIDIKLFEPRAADPVRTFECNIVARACTGTEKIFDVVGKDAGGHVLMKLTSSGMINALAVSSFSCSIDFCQTASLSDPSTPTTESSKTPTPVADEDTDTSTSETKTWNEILLSRGLLELLEDDLLEITLTAKGDTTEISFSLKTTKLLELLQKSQDDAPAPMQTPSPDPDCPPCYGHDDVPVTVVPDDPPPGPSPGPTPDPDQD